MRTPAQYPEPATPVPDDPDDPAEAPAASEPVQRALRRTGIPTRHRCTCFPALAWEEACRTDCGNEPS